MALLHHVPRIYLLAYLLLFMSASISLVVLFMFCRETTYRSEGIKRKKPPGLVSGFYKKMDLS